MALSKIKSNSIADDAITSDKVADGVISAADVADGTLTNAKLADGTIENAKLAGSIANDKLANSSVTINGNSVSLGGTTSTGMFRNIIINGDMSIAQRSTSVASITTASYYTLDRFYLEPNSAGTWTMSQSTDVPTGQGFAKSMKLDCTTADASPSAGDYMTLNTFFEGQNLQYLKKGTANAQSLTLSFWVKSTKTGTFIAEIRDEDNSRSISKSYTVDATNTWEKKTITYPADTTGTLNNDNGKSLSTRFWLVSGSSYSSGTLQTTWGSLTVANLAVGQVNIADSTSNDFYITGVQLEAGTTASDFEFLPVDVNLARCQRYFQTITGFVCYGIGTTTIQASYSFPTPMRANPSASQSAVLTISDGASNFAQSSTSITTQSAQVGSWFGLFGNFSGLTQFRPYGKTTTDAILFSAEL